MPTFHTRRDPPSNAVSPNRHIANVTSGASITIFFDWAFKNGSSAADSLDYISLPESVVSEIKS